MVLRAAAIALTVATAAAAASCGQGLTPLSDAGVRPLDGVAPVTGCPGLAFEPLLTWRHPGADLSLAVARGAALAEVTIKTPGPLEAAATVDWIGGVGDLSGLVLSRASLGADPGHQVYELAALLRQEKVFSAVTVRAPGEAGVSPDGHPMVRGILLDLKVASSVQINWARNNLLPLLLGGERSRFGELPRPQQAAGQALVLAGSIVLRRARGQLIFTGGVVTRNDYDIRISKARVRAADLANGTAVAAHASRLAGRCAPLAIPPGPALDLLWIIDEGDAMLATRLELHDGIPGMWTEATKLGLDFRMAVAGMGRLTDGSRSYSNGLCSTVTGQQGAFWSGFGSGDLPPQLQPCVLGPSGNRPAGSGAHGLTNLRETLASLLPRKAGDPRRLRTAAGTAVLLVSSRPASVVSRAFGGAAPPAPFTPAQAAVVGDSVAPFVALLRGDGGSLAPGVLPAATALGQLKGTVAHALTTRPETGCGVTSRGTGFLELAAAVGGRAAPICQDAGGVAHLLVSLARDMARRARPLALPGRTISASLTVGGGAGKLTTLSRSRRQGFDYHAASGSLLIYDGANPLSGAARASYLVWE